MMGWVVGLLALLVVVVTGTAAYVCYMLEQIEARKLVARALQMQ